MSDSLEAQIQQLQTTIATLEAQRTLLGNAVVDAAVAPLRQQLAGLEAQRQPVASEERRLVTILFTDIVGSMAMAEQLDPEEWRRTVAQLHSTVGTIVAQHQGQVLQYLGDGLLACFGGQQASERDPENAIRAALASQQAVRALRVPSPLQIRIGLHTGLVVVGELGSDTKKEFTATGDAMNLAARLQSAAPPGGILISHDTYRHVRGVFEVTPQPLLTLKGKREPVHTYVVRRAKPRPFRSVSRGVAGIETRTVGREQEFQRLQDAYLDAYENRRVVWAQMVGEAGIGKSRLMADLIGQLDLRPETFRLLRARAVEGDTGRPWALVRSMWFDRFQIAEDAPLAQAQAKWVQRFQELAGTSETEPAQALGQLIGLTFDSPSSGGLRKDPTEVRGRALVVSRELLARLRELQPVVVLLEDLQWADESSWEWLAEVVLGAEEARTEGQRAKHGLLVVGSARPEWRALAALRDYPRLVTVELGPLTDEVGRELVHDLLQKAEGMPADVVQLVVERSEGVPYYAEELVNYFLDRGIIDRSSDPWRFNPSRLKEIPLPSTLQHLLLTRLSALSEVERAALQRGAIFGRNFWTGGVEALGVHEGEVVLSQLQPRGLVEVLPESVLEGQTEWIFHHNLLRDVTYESVLKRERAELHRAAAQWLETQARQAGRLEEFAGLLAEHTERAGETLEAAAWYLQAGKRALGQGAVREAKRFHDRVLELLPPAEWEQRWRALQGRQLALEVLSDLDGRRADVEELVELASTRDDEGRLALALQLRGEVRHHYGDRAAAREDLDRAIALAERTGEAKVQVQAIGIKACILAEEGETQSAAQLADEAISRANEVEDGETLLMALMYGAYSYSSSGDYARAARLSQQLVEAAHQRGHRLLEGVGVLNLGGSYIWLGQYKRARQAVEESLRLADMLGAQGWRTFDLCALGEIHYFSGDHRTALRLQEEALREAHAMGDKTRYSAFSNEAGLVLEAMGDVGAAERLFQEARETARAVNQPFYEYEAVAGLAHCTLAQGRLDEARQLAFEAWEYLQVHGAFRMEHPMRPYGLCADIFDALGEPELARAVVAAGYRELMNRVVKISEPEWRASYLQNDPFNRELVERWEHLHG